LYLALLDRDEKVAQELMAICCALLWWKINTTDGVPEGAAASRNLFFTEWPRKTARTLATHILQIVSAF
jgi:hypothetical protein